MTAEENKALVRRYVDEAWRRRDRDAQDRYAVPEKAEAWKHHVRQLLDAFADLDVRIDDLFGEGDKVALRVTITGTHTGEFAGVPATNERITWTSIRIFRVAEGRLADTWAMQDRLGLMGQLGLVDPSLAAPIDWASDA